MDDHVGTTRTIGWQSAIITVLIVAAVVTAPVAFMLWEQNKSPVTVRSVKTVPIQVAPPKDPQ